MLLDVLLSFDPIISTFFFTNALPSLLTILHALSVDLMSSVNVVFIVSGAMT